MDAIHIANFVYQITSDDRLGFEARGLLITALVSGKERILLPTSHEAQEELIEAGYLVINDTGSGYSEPIKAVLKLNLGNVE
jgi:hypothetical protein